MIGVGTTIFLVRPQTFASGTSYLLDTYTAAAAYSLRALSSSTTNVVRVRRSSDSAESDFTATEITDGTLTTWTGANDGFVVTWYDQSGSSLDVTQSTAANQPRIVNAGVVETKNGKEGVFFNSSVPHSLTRASMTALHSEPFSFWSVGSNELSTKAPIFSNRYNGGTNDGVTNWMEWDTAKRGVTIDSSSTTEYNYLSQQNNNNQRLHGFTLDVSDNGEFFFNGTSQESTTLAASITDGSTFSIGRQILGNMNMYGFIQEIIIFNSDESANRTDIESDINTYYSIY